MMIGEAMVVNDAQPDGAKHNPELSPCGAGFRRLRIEKKAGLV
jgi:hypothetical protein